jgi:hypothetical protein
MSCLLVDLAGQLEVNRDIGRLEILENVFTAQNWWHLESIQLTWFKDAPCGPEINYEAWDEVVHDERVIRENLAEFVKAICDLFDSAGADGEEVNAAVLSILNEGVAHHGQEYWQF